MRTHRSIISSILATLFLTFTIVPAFADVTWNSTVSGTNNTTGDAQNIDYVRVGTDSTTDQYVMQMALDALPTGNSPLDNQTLYGIHLGGPTLSAPIIGNRYPNVLSSSDAVFAVWMDNAGFHQVQHGSPLEAEFRVVDTSLEWRVPTSSIASTSWFYGAIYELDHKLVWDTTQTAAVTPIPASAWLLGSGIIGLIGIMRRNPKRPFGEKHSLA